MRAEEASNAPKLESFAAGVSAAILTLVAMVFKRLGHEHLGKDIAQGFWGLCFLGSVAQDALHEKVYKDLWEMVYHTLNFLEAMDLRNWSLSFREWDLIAGLHKKGKRRGQRKILCVMLETLQSWTKSVNKPADWYVP